MNRLSIVYKPIDEIKAYEKNARKNENAIPAVMKSIEAVGFKSPIIIDANNEIIAGHTRLAAAKRLGYDEVPCIVADDLTPNQVKAYRLADNKTGEIAEWDFGLLEEELKELAATDYDIDSIGFSDSELQAILNQTIESAEIYLGMNPEETEDEPEYQDEHEEPQEQEEYQQEPQAESHPAKSPSEGKDLSSQVKEKFEVIVECENEADLEETYQALSEGGYKCRVLIL